MQDASLDLSHNNFSGSIPEAFFGSQLPSAAETAALLAFFLKGLPGGNGVSGWLSLALGELTRLTSLRISHHTLSGSLPASLSLLSHLVSLDLASNRHLSGAIPPALYALPSGAEVRLGHNALSGSIPDSVFSPCLALLDLSHNQLSSPIPPSLQGRSKNPSLLPLSHLDLSYNLLSGSIPPHLASSLSSLAHLSLRSNLLRW
ncbi:hypothetical protein CLOM_g14551 [Closterium sp. NIES-68]|nr:hypothetical protein CLOM_g14551 [Closterium sp. NIES-68]